LLESLLDQDAGACLHELKRSELVFERRGPERTFVFKHALTQSVAYQGLLESRRRELHAKAGRALERLAGDRLDEHYELVAYHFARSDDRQKAAEYLVLANRKAAARNAMEEAVSYFYAALAVLEELPDTRENRVRRASLLLDQTGEFHFLNRDREYYELLLRSEVLIRELDDDFLLGGYLARLGHEEWTVLADFPRAAATLRQAAEICERVGNEVDAGAAYAILAWTYQQIGDYPLVEVNRDLALAKLRRRFHPIWFQYAHAASVLAYTYAGQWKHALREAEIAITEGRSRGDAGIVSFSAAFASSAMLEQRDWKRAVQYAQLALREAPTVYFEKPPQLFLASYLCSTGQLGQGLPVLEAIVPVLEASEHRVMWMFSASVLADAYGSSGRVDDARELAERVLNWAERGGAGYVTTRAHRVLGTLEAAAGRPAAALAHLDRAIEVAGRTGSENELALALGERGRLLRGVEGRSDLERALAIFDRLGTHVEPERIRAELAAAAT
jgi:tetratricopeptide (TPR) repeat protein